MSRSPASVLRRPVCDLLACSLPLVLAGMGGVARSELVVAVSRAGGFGFLGMVREPPSLISEEVRRVREQGVSNFGVNLIPAGTDTTLLAAQIDTCIELHVPVVGLFWDVAPDVIRRLVDAGILVTHQVGSVEDAYQAQEAGAAVLIAQGVEAGGHVRADRPLVQLLPDVLAACSAPVLAAGGISDGADVASVMSLGAQGAVLGTALIATHQSFAHDYHKRRIVEAGANETVLTDVFHINWPRGAKVRVLANSVTRGERGDPFAPGATVIGHEAGRPIYLFSTDSPLRSMTGELEAMALYAGQGVGRIEAIADAATRLQCIAEDAASRLAPG
jgi:nitronate monooxygenase